MNREELKNKIRNFNSSLRESTLDAYVSNIMKMTNKLFSSDSLEVSYFSPVNKIKEYIESYENKATQKNILTAILVVLKTIDYSCSNKEEYKEYTDFHYKLSQEQRENYNLNQKTIKEGDNWITSTEIKERMNSIVKKIHQEIKSNVWSRSLLDLYQQYLIVALYTELPPIRNEYAETVVYNKLNTPIDQLECTTNYINMSKKQLILCKYKTSGKYGVKVIGLNDRLISIIESWFYIRHHVLKDGEDSKDSISLLLNTTKGNDMCKNGLTKYINKIFKPKKVSTTLLRKSFLSEKYPVIHTYQEMENDSYIMGHSVSTQQQIYRKQ